MKQAIGLHLRIDDSLLQMIQQAVRLNLPFFQCFFISQKTDKYILFDSAERKQFLTIRNQYFDNLYGHATYWINLAGSAPETARRMLAYEIGMAKRLDFTHIIVHPGSTVGEIDRATGIDTVARSLNFLLKHEKQVQLVLENTAHGNNSIGSDITDFGILLSKLDFPDRIQFCIDTAHAYGFGYDIANDQVQDQFIALLASTIPINSIALIHLNDTKEPLASKKDQHEIIGKGNIGMRSLMRLVNHQLLEQIPLLAELPPLSEQEQLKVLEELRNI